MILTKPTPIIKFEIKISPGTSINPANTNATTNNIWEDNCVFLVPNFSIDLPTGTAANRFPILLTVAAKPINVSVELNLIFKNNGTSMLPP